jgi:hypothetical protein
MASDMENPRRLVTLQRDGAEFVVSFYPERIVAFRHTEPKHMPRPSVASFGQHSPSLYG